MKSDRNTAIYVAYEEYVPRDPVAPERGLLIAVLLSALADLRHEGEDGRRAAEYLLSPEEDYLFSFRSVCGFLDIDPGKILMVLGLRPGGGMPGAAVRLPLSLE
jgi:hypothetical protein